MDLLKIFKMKPVICGILMIISGIFGTMFMYGGLVTLTGLISGIFGFLGIICYIFCLVFLIFTIIEMMDYL